MEPEPEPEPGVPNQPARHQSEIPRLAAAETAVLPRRNQSLPCALLWELDCRQRTPLRAYRKPRIGQLSDGLMERIYAPESGFLHGLGALSVGICLLHEVVIYPTGIPATTTRSQERRNQGCQRGYSLARCQIVQQAVSCLVKKILPGIRDRLPDTS